MTRTFLHIILLCTLSILAKGQQATIHSNYKEHQLDTFVTGLKKQGVDTIIVYSSDGYGLSINYNYIPDARSSRPTYVLWKKNNRTIMKRFDVYCPYKPVTLKHDTILIFAILHSDTISKEKLWGFEKKLSNNIRFKSSDHYNYYTVTLLFGDKKFNYQIEDYLTNDKFFDQALTSTLQFRLFKALKTTADTVKTKALKKEVY